MSNAVPLFTMPAAIANWILHVTRPTAQVVVLAIFALLGLSRKPAGMADPRAMIVGYGADASGILVLPS
jgi:hypothetical protein